MNPLFQQLNPMNQNPMIRQILDFKRTFSGNPQATIQQMLNSGRITQDQINRLSKQADEIYKQMKGFL